MTSSELENLIRIGTLKREAVTAAELDGLTRSGEARLTDAANTALSLESRFDLAYNAAHALALAGLRRLGLRSDNRYVVFQALPHTLGVPSNVWRLLAKCHGLRNQAEYEGALEVDETLVTDLVDAARSVSRGLKSAGARPS